MRKYAKMLVVIVRRIEFQISLNVLIILEITSLSAGSSLKYLHDFQISSFGGSHGPGSTTSEPFSLNKKLQSLKNTCTFASKQFFGG